MKWESFSESLPRWPRRLAKLSGDRSSPMGMRDRGRIHEDLASVNLHLRASCRAVCSIHSRNLSIAGTSFFAR
jgi:hypothetical protein